MAEIAINVRQAAKRSGIGVAEIYWHCKNNPSFPAFRVGRKILIHIEAFDKWVENLAKTRIGFKK